MISLWILAIITILAVSIGHRVSLALRISSYQQDRIKAYCLARAGIQRAIAELEKDKDMNQYDSLSESWSTGTDPVTNNPLFENIEIEEGSGQTFTLRYPYDKDTYFCMVDEESKVNINTASPGLLLTLLKALNMEAADAQRLTNYIRTWRGDSDSTIPIEDVYKYFKKKPFIVPEELILILESFYQSKEEENYQQKAQEAFDTLKYLITVYPTAAININTASSAVLTIIANSVAIQREQPVDGLINKIINFRKGDSGPFTGTNITDFSNGLTTGDEQNLFSKMKSSPTLALTLAVNSDYFDIGSTGNAGKLAKKINAVYNRPGKTIVYWHEN